MTRGEGGGEGGTAQFAIISLYLSLFPEGDFGMKKIIATFDSMECAQRLV